MFKNLILIFNGEKIKNHYESDISLVLYPLPKLPILICYWKQEEGMESDLHLLFDSSATLNANIDIVYEIAADIVVMFEKISLKHGVEPQLVFIFSICFIFLGFVVFAGIFLNVLIPSLKV